ncbi:MAG: C40 family peptidase [Saprospiraceae bacterium]|nr:C40 family peptidase [Saprospiraceae bacterium]
MTFNRNKFIRTTNYLKNISLVLLVAFITVKCDVLNELTTEPLPKAGTSKTTPKTPTSSKEIALRQDIVTYAKKYQGTKYQAAGKTPKTGFDCSGFTCYVMDNFDIDLSPSSRTQSTQGTSKPIEKVEPGDLIFFRRSKSEPIFHVAMVVENDRKSLKVIHSTSRGVVVDDILASEYWKPKIDSARDVVSLAQ